MNICIDVSEDMKTSWQNKLDDAIIWVECWVYLGICLVFNWLREHKRKGGWNDKD